MKINYLKIKKKIALFAFAAGCGLSQAQTVTTFSYSGGPQSFTVPSCVATLTIMASGAQGGTAAYPGANGGSAQGVLTVVAGQVLNIYVGGMGGVPTVTAAGFNGGGPGGISGASSGAGGGGGTDVRIGGIALSDRILAAGGGGGGGGTSTAGGSYNATAGTGGGGTSCASPLGFGGGGGSGCSGILGGPGACAGSALATGYGTGGAGAGTNSGGPTSGSGTGTYGGAGAVGVGGFGGGYPVVTISNGAGGGGGGYYGGAGGMSGSGGCNGGGGGGSSWVGTTLTGGTFTAGNRAGDGIVVITYSLNGTGVFATVTPSAICVGGTANIVGSGVNTFTWQPVGAFSGSNSSTISVTPTVNTTYTVDGTNSLGCLSKYIFTIPVNQTVPSLTIVNTANAGGICPTKTVALTASGATTYTWTGGATTVTNGVAFAPPTATNYTVTGTNACGSTTAAASVSVHPLPTVIAVASTPSLCSGLTVTLNTTGSNASTYTWTGGQTSGTGFSPVLTNTYTVTGTSALSCTASAAVVVTVVTTPVLAPTASTLINCIGNSVTLTATGATNYTWTSATQTVFTPTLAATPSATGISTYTVIKSNSNCFDVKTISVTTNSLPTIFAIASPTLVCAGSPATLAIGGGISYTWTAPGTPTTSFNGAAPVVYPVAPSTYSAAASDGTCINRTTVFLNTNPVPTINIVPTSSTICDGQSVTLNATGGINYTWTSTSGAPFTNTASISETPSTTVAYNIIGDNSFNCYSTAMQVVIVNPNPTITISASRTLVCSNGNTSLTANGANSYTWTSNNALTNTTVVNPVSLTSAPVIYTAVGAYTTGCQGSKTIAINVFVPSLTVNGNTNTCAGGMITLNGGGGNNGTYTWSTGSSTSNFQVFTTTVAAASVFTLSASSTSITTTCPSTKTVAVGIYFNPTITAVAQRTTICIKESTQLYGEGGVSYTWNTSAQGGTITVNPITQTNYTVTGTDANGCVSTGTVQVKVSGCVGIDELTKAANSLLVYPNPNNGSFTIQSDLKCTLNLVNELGQVIMTYDLSDENNYKAAVNNLAKGIYFISGQGNTSQINKKIIVTR